MAQRDMVALGLSAAVVVGLFLLRKPPAQPKGGETAPTDPNLAQARVLIATVTAQAQNATPEQRALLAGQLEAAAAGLQATSPAAAGELKAAADKIRAGGGMGPGPQPPPPPPPPPPTTLLDRFRSLEQKIKDYLAAKAMGGAMGGAARIDATTLAEADRTAADLQKAGYGTEAGVLTALATAAYAASGIQRPIGLTL